MKANDVQVGMTVKYTQGRGSGKATVKAVTEMGTVTLDNGKRLFTRDAKLIRKTK